jgi:prepilin-type N-terminal cleavage/methylation domain-containing protein
MKQKGFTLIELLVVIAIIGILSSVVLASLNTARAKGADASIKSNLAGIRAQAEIMYDSAGCYNNNGGADCTIVADDGDCAAANTEDDSIFENTTVQSAIQAAGNASNGGGLATGECVASANGAAWAITVPLKGVAGAYWCVDSTGASKQTAAQQAAADVTCN